MRVVFTALTTRMRIVTFLIVIAAVTGGVLFVLTSFQTTVKKETDRILSSCADFRAHDLCYEALVPALYPRLTVAQLFDVVRGIRARDTSYQFCHVLSHKIGEAVVAQDPARWRDALAFNPPGNLCSNGYLHGVVGGRFRSEVLDDHEIESLLPDFSLACEPSATWNPTSFDSAVCYHGMGHLYVFITNADIPKALELCRQTITPDGQRICLQGVFMQIFQPLEPDDYQLIAQMKTKPTKSTVRKFCAAYKESPEYVGSCLEESWPLFRAEILSGTGAIAFCSGYPNEEEELYCWMGISAIIGRMSLEDSTKVERACDQFPAEWQGTCYAGGAQAVIEENQSATADAVALCGKAPVSAAEECYAWLAKHARSIFGDAPARSAFCALLPQMFQDQCAYTRG